MPPEIEPIKEAELIKCEYRSDEFKPDEIEEINGDQCCENCKCDHFAYCEECNEWVNQDDINEVKNKFLCDDCFDDLAFKCAVCDESDLQENSYSHGSNRYCMTCYDERFGVCGECCESFDIENLNEDGLCRDCQPQGSELINDYSYQPKLEFHKEKWEGEKYLGVELEIETSKNVDDLAKSFKAFLKSNSLENYLYFKEDGSLENGFEIVSHPFTLKAFHNKMKWRKILQWLKDNGATSHMSGRCGMHVHVTGKAVSLDDRRKIKLFMHQNRAEMIKFSARLEDKMGYCQLEKYTIETYEKDKKEGEVYQMGRHVAFNAHTSKGTCEFRLFRGTLNYKRFLASLQFSDALSEFVKQATPGQIAGGDSFDDFMKWLKRRARHQHLWKYLDLLQSKKLNLKAVA